MKKRPSGLLLLHIAVLAFALSSVIARSITWPSVMIAWGRVALSSTFLFLLLRQQGVLHRVSDQRDRIRFLIAGVLLAAHWTTFTLSVKEGSVAIATVTFAAFPMFTAFLEPIFFRETFKAKDFLFAAIMLVGVILLAEPSALTAERTIGIVYGMIASFTYALLSLMNRDLGARYPGEKVSFREQSVAFVVLTPALFFYPIHFDLQNLARITLLGILCTAIAYSLFVNALKTVRVQTAGLVSGLETVYAIAFAALLLGESPTRGELIGGAIVLGVALISTLQANREELSGLDEQ